MQGINIRVKLWKVTQNPAFIFQAALNYMKFKQKIDARNLYSCDLIRNS